MVQNLKGISPMAIMRYFLVAFFALNYFLCFNKAAQGAPNNVEEIQVVEQESTPFSSKSFLLADNFQKNNKISDSQKQAIEKIEARFKVIEEKIDSKEVSFSKDVFPDSKDGLCLYSNDENGFELALGGSMQMDYRYYNEDARADNRFDIRRARMSLSGSIHNLLTFFLEYEFQGNDLKNLLNAYGDIKINGAHSFRFGQFKEPFSFELQTKEAYLFFAERSMGYYLTPGRDIGLMLQGSFCRDAVDYSFGLFNGDGTDGSSRGNQSDEPEIAACLVLTPFQTVGWAWLKYFHIGGSVTYADIDLSNVDLEVKSTGMVETNRNLYVLNSNTKFGVLHDVDQRVRAAFGAGWAWDRLALQGEYINLAYTDLKPAGGFQRDADFSSWYISALCYLTGEHPEFKGGILQQIKPENDFSSDRNTFGALGIGARLEHFSGDEAWIVNNAFVSVREADALSLALNWIMNPFLNILLDYTYTDLTDLIRVRVNPDGSVDYIDEENVLTCRFQLNF
jgi:phosphate-selective porin OprO/OprP